MYLRFMIYTQTGQTSYNVSLTQVFKADYTLALIISQHIFCKTTNFFSNLLSNVYIYLDNFIHASLKIKHFNSLKTFYNNQNYNIFYILFVMGGSPTIWLSINKKHCATYFLRILSAFSYCIIFSLIFQQIITPCRLHFVLCFSR